MDYMKWFSDKHFELAIVDPPYGISVNMNAGRKKDTACKKRESKDWDDSIPDASYFYELFRVSKAQILWGGNYFPLPLTGAWTFWDKCVADGCSFSDGELAWRSFGKTLEKCVIPWSGFIGANGARFHPTQKPVALYKWLLSRYAKQGDKILDTHLGSGSSRIAAWDLGFDFYATELDKDYFEAQEKRFSLHKAQGTLFDPVEFQKEATQGDLF
jgi:site-specific DNA-methyltransferase (adenine-specific)